MIITFMSDFGTEDGYVGAVKGKLKAESPQADIIDIGHSIPPFDIKKAAYSLLTYYNQFPKGTIHLCVVDPGVGSKRKPVILESEKYLFIGPDNGLFDLVVKHESVKVYKINLKPMSRVSSIFDGRDIFAPVAASLANGQAASALGTQLKNFGVHKNLFFKQSKNKYIVELLTADRFGNIIFGIRKKDVGNRRIQSVEFMGHKFNNVSSHYAQEKVNQALC